MTWLLSLLNCRHARRSWPQTPINRRTGWRGETYSVCLDCGERLAGGLPELDEPATRLGAAAREEA